MIPENKHHPDIHNYDDIPIIPTRVIHADLARKKFGEKFDILAPYYMYGDPLADKLIHRLNELPAGQGTKLVSQAMHSGLSSVHRPPKELIDFFEAVEDVPLWIDWDLFEKGGSAVLRAGHLAIIVLGAYSLPLSYASPDGNKPLLFTKKLIDRATRRLVETSRFILEICRPGGLQQGHAGYQITLRVRLMHAQVRRLLIKRGIWRMADWGMPISQSDMLATNLLFSVLMIDGLKKLGFHLSEEEIHAVMQLWRYAGLLMGIQENLSVITFQEGYRILTMMKDTSAPPNEDSIRLVQALRQCPNDISISMFLPKTVNKLINADLFQAFLFAVTRYLIGDTMADQLKIEKNHFHYFFPPVFAGISLVSFLSQLNSIINTMTVKEGVKVWDRVVELSKHLPN